MGHANTRIFATQLIVEMKANARDPFDPMTMSPGKVSFNAAHLHYLGWFGPTEEAWLSPGIEYTLKAINDGSRDFTALKSLVYNVPNSTREVWFSYVQMSGGGWKSAPGMPGTGIAVHEASGGATFLEDLIGLVIKTEIRSGLTINITAASTSYVTVVFSVDPEWVVEF